MDYKEGGGECSLASQFHSSPISNNDWFAVLITFSIAETENRLIFKIQGKWGMRGEKIH